VLALMEKAAVQAIALSLDSGQTTVGVSAELTHSAATPIGGRVEAEARVTAVNGRQIDFMIKVTDQATGNEVAKGLHRRMVVDYARFVRQLSPSGKDQP
jgi:predicted thioesterase